MEEHDLKPPPYRVLTFRDDKEILCEDVETQVAARTRYASAIDLCRSREDAHAYRVELRAGEDTIEAWPDASG